MRSKGLRQVTKSAPERAIRETRGCLVRRHSFHWPSQARSDYASSKTPAAPSAIRKLTKKWTAPRFDRTPAIAGGP